MLDTRTSAQAHYFDTLSALLGSGVPLLRTLNMLAAIAPSAELQAESRRLAAAVSGGQPLSAAMAEAPLVFGPRAVAFVRAGEVGGVLDRTTAALARALRATDGQATESWFAYLLGVLLQARVPYEQALASAAEVLDEPRRAACRGAEAGGLARSLRQSGGFAPLTVEFIAVGEELGQLEPLCLRAAELLGNG
ncbi:MAG: type II secretion system F family protein [Armatimonadetes bacterium]|nr:type II secretion system F family protein [Armatimonadota bacterium]